jgi:hypothetical protein
LCEVEYTNRIGLTGKHFAKIQNLANYVPEALEYGRVFLNEIARLKDQGFPIQSKYPRARLTYAAVLYKMISSQSFGGLHKKAENLNFTTDPEEKRYVQFKNSHQDDCQS